MNNVLPLVLWPFGTLQFVPYVTDFSECALKTLLGTGVANQLGL